MNTVIIAGTDMGIMILMKVFQIEQPSIIAASSISRGMLLKKPVSIKIVVGRAKAEYGIIRDNRESVKPTFANIIKRGIKVA
jgi:hypothetical protein